MSVPVAVAREPLIRVRELSKIFGVSRALDAVSLDIYPAEVVALLGANGAGKSTLVKILAGSQTADAGEIWLEGAPRHFSSPLSARRFGIVAVHQQINEGIAPGLSVAENLLLDELCKPDADFWLNRKRLLERAASIAAGLGLVLPLEQPIEHLGQAERQLVVLARALALQPRLLILDEPTAALSDAEAQRLFGLIDTLRSRGVAILYISHRLSDLQRVADRAIVLRDGKFAGEFTARQLPEAVSAMLGHTLAEHVYQPRVAGREVLQLNALQILPRSAAFDLTLHENEVVVLTGLLGAGKSEIAEVLFGLRKAASGRVQLDGADWRADSPRQAIQSGVFFAAEDRASQSLVADFSLRRTLTLPFLERFTRGGFIRNRAEAAAVEAQVAELGIKTAGIDVPMSALSGGNQQKVVLGRWLLGEGRVLILDEPFQGVDVRARRDIGQLLRDSAKGRATLVICADVDEALEIADRILLVRDHAVVAEYPRAGLNRADLVAARPAATSPNIPLKPRQGAERVPDSSSLLSTEPARAERLLHVLIRYGLLWLLALIVVFFSVAEPAFLRVGNLFSILQSVSIVALLALGVTLTMAVGGLDLSIGAVAAMSLMIASYVMVVLGWGAVPAVLISLAGGALVGLLNGWLIVKLRVPDILATLGSMFLVIGVQLIPTGGRSIAVGMTLPSGEETEGTFSAAFLALGRGRLWEVVPIPVLITAVVALAVWLFLERTRIGRLFYAIGGNEQAARLAGAPVQRFKLLAYVLSALLASLGGLLLAARLGRGDVSSGNGLVLDALGAALIGFAVLGAKKPNAFGTLIGALLVAALLNGLTMLNAPYYAQDFVKGLVLVLALMFTFGLAHRAR